MKNDKTCTYHIPKISAGSIFKIIIKKLRNTVADWKLQTHPMV